MQALIFNSGRGTRMGEKTADRPKCMTEIAPGVTIIAHQLEALCRAGVQDVVITTGPFEQALRAHVEGLKLPMTVRFVRNEAYASTNYIYSMHLARSLIQGELITLHGDLVMEQAVLSELVAREVSCVAVDRTLPLPEKDFKALIQGGRVRAVGIEFFGEGCEACQPAYRLTAGDARLWFDEVAAMIEAGERGCYAEKALNRITDRLALNPFELDGRLMNEIDNPEDLAQVSARFRRKDI